MLEYRVLGPLTVLVDGRPMKLGGRRQQLVLATLLTHANLTISQDALIEEVWAGDPPEAARATLQSYIYGLRRELGPGAILRVGEGYHVDADASTLDSMLFEQLVGEARRQMAEDPEAATGTLNKALALWRGSAYEGLAANPALLTDVTRLEELRLAALEVRIEAELTAGHHAALVGELESLVRQHPLRERLRAQLMLALYGSGRQAEALRAYQQARIYLAEELGIEPSRELRELEQRILDQDPLLDLRPPSRTAAHGNGGGSRSLAGYELKSVLGSGDYATVYQASQPGAQREVAVKVIRPEYAGQPEFVLRFEQEAQIVAQLDHPHIVPLFDYWRDPEGAYLVMPLMRGGSLDSALGPGGWSLTRALPVIDQICGALCHAQRRGINHGAIRTTNVLLDSEGNAYLADFGIAQSLGTVVSSDPAHLEAPPDSSPDLAALANLTFQILTGVSPTMGSPLPDLADARPDLPFELGKVLSVAANGSGSTTYPRIEDFYRAVKQAVGVDVVTPVVTSTESESEPLRNPYKGLRAFRDSDAEDYFGRDDLIDELLGALTTANVVTVVGPSGSGKSSLVRAGLVPALRQGAVPGSGEWLVTDMFPGSHPFEELEAALLRVAVDRPSNLLDELTDARGLLRVSKRILPSEDVTLLLLVDQFEELFSTVRSEEARRAFLDNLVSVASDERSKVKVVLTLRADFLDRPLAYSPFSDVVGDCLVTVGPPGREGLAQAISGPARAAGVEVEPGLAGLIIADVESQPAVLPLLQFTLTELFERRDRGRLTIEGYEAMGGVQRALGSRAEELFSELPEAVREECRQIFLRLVSLSEDRAPTRRRVAQAELRNLAIDDATIDLVLGRFGGVRLLTFDREPATRIPTVELAHESLLEEWPRLRDWLIEHRDALIVARQIGGLTREWLDSDRDPSFLLRGVRLRQAEAWVGSAELVPTDDETAFIEESLEAERTAAQVARRRRRMVISGLAAALGVTSLLAAAATWQWQTATRESREGVVRDLASDSVAALNQDPELALLLGLESAELSLAADDPINLATTNALVLGLRASRLVQTLEYEAKRVEVAGSLIVTITPSSAVVAHSALDGEVVWTLSDRAHEIGASPDGRQIAAAYRSTDIDVPSHMTVWDVNGPTEILTFPVAGKPASTSFSWSADGQVLAALTRSKSEAEVYVADLDTGHVNSFAVPGGYAVVFVSDDTLAVSNPDAQRVDFIGLDGSERGSALNTPGLSPGLVAFDAEGGRLVVGSTDAKWAQAWDLSDMRMVWDVVLPHPGAAAFSMDISAATNTVALSSGDGGVRLFGLAHGDEQITLLGHQNPVNAFDFDTTGHRLVTFANQEGGRVWDVSPGGIGSVSAGTDAPCHILISADGSQVAFAATTGTFNMIDLATGSVLHSVPDQEIGFEPKATVSGDWSVMSWRDEEGIPRIWDVRTGDPISELPPCVIPKALNQDGSLLVVQLCGPNSGGQVMDGRTGEVLFDLGSGVVWEASFSSGGGSDPDRYVVTSTDGEGRVYDLDQRRQIAAIEVPEGDAFGALAVDRAGRYMATGSELGYAYAYNLPALISGTAAEDALELAVKVSSSDPVPGVAVEGGLLATSTFRSLRVWDIAGGTLVAEPSVGIDTPPFSTFGPDARELFYVDDGYVVRKLILDPDLLVEEVRGRLTRGLTEEECDHYLGPEACSDL